MFRLLPRERYLILGLILSLGILSCAGIATPKPFRIPAAARAPSPGRQAGDIAFIHNGDIYTATIDAKDVRRLTKDGCNAFPIWSPDGKRLAFAKTAKRKSPLERVSDRLWIISADGRYSRPLTKFEDLTATFPIAWIPGGRELLVAEHYMDSDVAPNLTIVTLIGRPSRRFAKWLRAGRSAGFLQQFPGQATFTAGQAGDFLSDGKTMIFTAGAKPLIDTIRLDLYRMDIAGANVRRLAPYPKSIIYCLRWSPAAKKLLSAEAPYAYIHDRSPGIWLLNSNGRRLKKIADSTTASLNGMDWSPDGKYVIFQKTDSEYSRQEWPGSFRTMSSHASIWVMKADGSGKYKLVDNACNPNWR